MPIDVRRAELTDAAALHDLALLTFGLACPPGTTQEAVDDFLATTLSAESFAHYLTEPDRDLFLAFDGENPLGYTMLVFGEPTDPDVIGAISLHPTCELSKVYVLADQHGQGVSAALMDASLAAARTRGCAGIWLGVNQFNPRANRFYEKHGFANVGTKRFLLGGVYENDFVRERAL